MTPVSVNAYRINFRKMLYRILWQGFLFLLVFAVAIVSIYPLNIPDYIETIVFMVVLLADVAVLIYEVRRIITVNVEVKVVCILQEGGLEEKIVDSNEIRMVPFASIRSYELGQATYPREGSYFRIKLKNSSEEIYISTDDEEENIFFEFTGRFIKEVDKYNASLTSSITKIKKLN